MSADRRRALIGRAVIGNRRGTVTAGDFAGIALAATTAALAPVAGCGMTGVSGRRKRVADRFAATGR